MTDYGFTQILHGLNRVQATSWLRLTQNSYDVFNEVVDCGKNLRTTFDRHPNNDNEREHKPGHESNYRRITYQHTRIE